MTFCSLFNVFFPFVHSPDLPENEATFAITAGGINDAKEWDIQNRDEHSILSFPSTGEETAVLKLLFNY